MSKGKSVVAAGHALTAQAAAEILQDGGNAFDAALAGVFMSFVAEAVFSSPGGGGFLMARPAGSDTSRLFDFFTETPLKRRATTHTLLLMNGSDHLEPQAGLPTALAAANKKYEWGFATEIEQDFAPKGLSEDTVRYISAKKGEPEWMLDWRLKAFRLWQTLETPDWAKLNIPPIDYQDAYYYAEPKQKKTIAIEVAAAASAAASAELAVSKIFHLFSCPFFQRTLHLHVANKKTSIAMYVG